MHLFNLSLVPNETPLIWKSVFVLSPLRTPTLHRLKNIFPNSARPRNVLPRIKPAYYLKAGTQTLVTLVALSQVLGHNAQYILLVKKVGKIHAGFLLLLSC